MRQWKGQNTKLGSRGLILAVAAMTGVWLIAGLGFLVVLVCMAVSMVPPGDSSNKVLFEAKLFIGTLAAIVLGLVLYWRGAREKRSASA